MPDVTQVLSTAWVQAESLYHPMNSYKALLVTAAVEPEIAAPAAVLPLAAPTVSLARLTVPFAVSVET